MLSCAMMQQTNSPTSRLLTPKSSSASSPKFLVSAGNTLHDLHGGAQTLKLLGSSASSPASAGPPSSSAGCSTSRARSTTTASSSLLKRKRPPTICIPALECSQLLTQQQQEEDQSAKSQAGECYGVCFKRGKRRIMEDTFTAAGNVNGDPKLAFYGVFDGHGGQEAAQFAAGNLLGNILSACPSENCEPGAKELRDAYHTTDCEFLRLGYSSGTSCVTAFVSDRRVVVANAGDCRAVLVRSDGVAVQLTQDHRVGCAAERQRIERQGGVVDCFTGTWRVQGVLAVSRGIGDLHLKQFISPEPDITSFELTDESQFLILASDGLWDQVSNEEAAECTLKILSKGSSSTPELLATACHKLVDISLQKGCPDDITVIVVQLLKSGTK